MKYAVVGVNAIDGVEAAFCEIEMIHHLMSFHEENSDVSRINRASAGEILRIDHRTYEVISCAQLMSRLSAGAFDITVGSKLVEEGFLPRPHGAASCDSEASFEDVVLLPNNRVTLKRRIWIDLGGIAKGYAVDRAVQTLKQCEVTSGIVNAGGDLYVFGDPQTIYVRHPQKASFVLPLGPVANVAVASSSGLFTARDKNGIAVDALVEPRQGACVKWRRGITVIASTCMVADALTKIVRLALRRVPSILSQFSAQALIIDRRGIRCSRQLAPRRDSEFRWAAPFVNRFETLLPIL
jgi:thiamine biosynthesis lipoprotein